VLDVSWTFSLRRTPGSDELAARMSGAALGALGQYGRPVDPRTADAIGLACGYVVAHGRARHYRVALSIDGDHCVVSVTDYGYDQPGEPSSSSLYRTTRLRRALAGCGPAADSIQVHHALEDAVLVRFRAGLPVG
jgi:hypothetical protein